MRRALAVLIAVMLVTLVLLAGCSSGDRASTPGSPATQTPFALDIPHPADQADILVAWTQHGTLYAWTNGTVHELGGEGLTQPMIAPDGRWIAALGARDAESDALWIAQWPDGQAALLPATTALGDNATIRNLLDIVWSPDSSAIYANTRTGSGIGTRSADDLWRIDPASGAMTKLLPDGEGGSITPSPDGRWLALASAGEYEGEPGALRFYAPATGDILTTLTYPAVATASEWRWHTAPQWAPDGSGVWAAIPPVDLVYAHSTDQPTALWWVPLDGDPQPIGTIDAHFFGLPSFSADGSWLAAMQPQPAAGPNAIALVLAAADGSEPAIYREGEVGTLAAPEWLPQGAAFTFVAGGPGQRWIGSPHDAPERFPADDIPAQDVIWLDGDTFVLSSGTADSFALYLGTWPPDGTIPRLIAEVAAYPSFDARIFPQITP